MNIIGINAFHGDAAAALVVDGQLVAAVEEERFNRIKHWAGFPQNQFVGACNRLDSRQRMSTMSGSRLIPELMF